MSGIRLEVLARRPKGAVRPTPLLFVHGAYSSARIWEPFFLPYFADHGYSVHAVSLRGHGGSEIRGRLATARLRDYVSDVADVAHRLERPPAVIGHSMGGMVVQHYLNIEPAPAAVLMASGPPHGTLISGIAMALTNPLLAQQMTLMQNLGPKTATLAGAKRALFRDDTPDDHIRKVLPPAEPESHLAVLDMMGLDLPPATPKTRTPVQVLSGDCDPFVSRGGVDVTAKAYKTEAVIFPGMPHALMLDPEWETVASCMLNWLNGILPEAST